MECSRDSYSSNAGLPHLSVECSRDIKELSMDIDGYLGIRDCHWQSRSPVWIDTSNPNHDYRSDEANK